MDRLTASPDYRLQTLMLPRSTSRITSTTGGSLHQLAAVMVLPANAKPSPVVDSGTAVWPCPVSTDRHTPSAPSAVDPCYGRSPSRGPVSDEPRLAQMAQMARMCSDTGVRPDG